MRYLYVAFVVCTIALVCVVIGVIRHIRRHNAEVSAQMETHETATNHPLD